MSYVLPVLVQLLRHRAELTQAALAERLGVTPSAVTQKEKPEDGMQERIFAEYAEALGLTESDALRDGLDLLDRLRAGETLEDLFPHLRTAAEARAERASDVAPSKGGKAGKPSKIHRRAKVAAPAKPAPKPAAKRSPSKIRVPKRAAPLKPGPAKKGAAAGARVKHLPRYPATGRAIFVASMGVEIVDLEVLTGDALADLDARVGSGQQVRRLEATVYVVTRLACA